MSIILETERLQLREFTIHDAAFIVELVNTPGWLKFIGDRNIRTEADAVEYLQSGPIKSYQVYGFGLSLVQLKSDLTPLGMCGIITRDWLERPDIGFAFLPGFTGKGYAYEMAEAVMAFAVSRLHLPAMYAITVPGNERSIKLLEKLGMKYIRKIKSKKENGQLLLFGN